MFLSMMHFTKQNMCNKYNVAQRLRLVNFKKKNTRYKTWCKRLYIPIGGKCKDRTQCWKPKLF